MTTWNLGQEDTHAFRDSPQTLFNKIHEYQMVVVCAQESKKQFQYKRLTELDQYMTKHGFVNVDKFVRMW